MSESEKTQRKNEVTLRWHEKMAEKERKEKAKKVRFDLDEYHKRMGGLYDKKVIFYCMPEDQLRIRKARRLFEQNGGGAKGGLFITITDENHKQGSGILLNKKEEIVIDPIHSFIIIDNINLINPNKLIDLLNKFRSSIMTGKLFCFGTNADKNGKAFLGARHLERVADEVIYETSFPCYFCGEYGKTSFTKLLFDKYEPRPDDCVIYDEYDDEEGDYHEKDLCFDCRYMNTKKDSDDEYLL